MGKNGVRTLIIILVILIIYGILRNINIPFGIYLRPTLV